MIHCVTFPAWHKLTCGLCSSSCGRSLCQVGYLWTNQKCVLCEWKGGTSEPHGDWKHLFLSCSYRNPTTDIPNIHYRKTSSWSHNTWRNTCAMQMIHKYIKILYDLCNLFCVQISFTQSKFLLIFTYHLKCSIMLF